MVEEARLEDTGAGLAPASEGWFVLNVRDAAWLVSDTFAAAGIFEGEGYQFPQVGYTVGVLQPGQPSGLYHGSRRRRTSSCSPESACSSSRVRNGACGRGTSAIARRDTEHIFVGAGDGPCVIFMVGARAADRAIVYPRSELARRRGAGAEQDTTVPAEAYAPFTTWRPGGPTQTGLPWA